MSEIIDKSLGFLVPDLCVRLRRHRSAVDMLIAYGFLPAPDVKLPGRGRKRFWKTATIEAAIAANPDLVKS